MSIKEAMCPCHVCKPEPESVLVKKHIRQITSKAYRTKSFLQNLNFAGPHLHNAFNFIIYTEQTAQLVGSGKKKKKENKVAQSYICMYSYSVTV